jgi:pullulanase
VIVMSLHDDGDGMAVLDERYASLVIVWNAGPDVVRVDAPALAGVPYLLHPVQADGVDADTLYGSYVATASGQVRVPGFSTVVFVAPRAP